VIACVLKSFGLTIMTPMMMKSLMLTTLMMKTLTTDCPTIINHRLRSSPSDITGHPILSSSFRLSRGLTG